MSAVLRGPGISPSVTGVPLCSGSRANISRQWLAEDSSGGSLAAACASEALPDAVAESLQTLGRRRVCTSRRFGIPDPSSFGGHAVSVVLERALNGGPEARGPRHTSVPSNCRSGGRFVRPAAAGMHRPGRSRSRG